MNYKLSPSEFSFLYESCKRCYYHRVARNIFRPSIPLPSIFSQIATLLKTHYDGKPTSELYPDLPPGTVKYGEQWVKSKTIELPGHSDTCYIAGRFDIVIAFDDKTYGVVDFKTGSPKEEYMALYGRQLHAYAYALEHAAPGALALSPVSKLGLLYFFPSGVTQVNTRQLSYVADIHWVEIEKNEADFLKFIKEVLTLLESPEPPEATPGCNWCEYVTKLGS